MQRCVVVVGLARELVDFQGFEPRCPLGRRIYSPLRSPMPPEILMC